ncbi:hypothetical protein ACTPOK_12695 [Streptomyces inhibens]
MFIELVSILSGVVIVVDFVERRVADLMGRGGMKEPAQGRG